MEPAFKELEIAALRYEGNYPSVEALLFSIAVSLKRIADNLNEHIQVDVTILDDEGPSEPPQFGHTEDL